MSAIPLSTSTILSSNLKRWATLQGSLTQHLERRLNQKLQVTQCHQQLMLPNPLEQALAFQLTKGKIHSKTTGFCREVILGNAKEDWVLARVFVPQHHMKTFSWLKNAENKPMGRQLYKQRSTARTLLYLQHFKTCSDQYGWPFLSFSNKAKSLTPKLTQSLVRVSRVAFQATEFLITEAYLADLIHALENRGQPYWSRS